MTSTSINRMENNNGAGDILNVQVGVADDGGTPQAKEERRGRTESELRAAARRKGLTLKELSSVMGVNYSHLCSVANGRRPWTPDLRERAMAALGEVPGQGVVYREGGAVTGESSFIRERAREKGMSLRDLAVVVGVSYGFMAQAARGQRNMSPRVQAQVESALGGPVEIAPARCANRQESIGGGGSSYLRERAREIGMSLGELADEVGISRSYMSQASRGHRNFSPRVQARVGGGVGGPCQS